MIAVDWGTSSFRAFRLRGGAIVERAARPPNGILQVEPAASPPTLRRGGRALARARRDARS